MLSARSGITILETLMVVTLIAILGATIPPIFSNVIIRNHLITTTDNLIGTIRKAQQYTMDGKNNVTWGVCLSNGKIRLFASSCASPTQYEDFEVPESVTIAGLSTTTFTSLRGEPSSAITVTISTAIDAKTVTVNAAGGMDIL